MKTFATQEEISRVEATMRPPSRNWWDWNLWLQWALANVVGEVLGLGLAGAVAIVMVLTIAAAGASVGAIHGVALLWLLRKRQEEASPAIEDA